MAVQSVQDVALSQVPNLERRIVAAGQQVSSIRMEVDLIHLSAVGVVVLDQALAPDIPNLDGSVLGAAGQACAIWMELDSVNRRFMIAERVDQLP